MTGLPVLTVSRDRAALARYGLNVADVQDVVATAIGGKAAGQIFEGDRASTSWCACPKPLRNDPATLDAPAGAAAGERRLRAARARSPTTSRSSTGPNQISRENGKRRVVVTANVRGRDLGSFVAELRERDRAARSSCRPATGSTTAARSSS